MLRMGGWGVNEEKQKINQSGKTSDQKGPDSFSSQNLPKKPPQRPAQPAPPKAPTPQENRQSEPQKVQQTPIPPKPPVQQKQRSEADNGQEKTLKNTNSDNAESKKGDLNQGVQKVESESSSKQDETKSADAKPNPTKNGSGNSLGENNKEKREFSREDEIEIARLQCDDEDNAAAMLDQNEVIEKSYKAGLSDQDKQRKKRKLRRLLLVLLLFLLLGGTVSATYFIIKNKTEYVPEFYDNVSIKIINIDATIDPDGPDKANMMIFPGDELYQSKLPISVKVSDNTEDITYDIVALGIKVTASYKEDPTDHSSNNIDCSEILNVGFCDKSQIFPSSNIEFVDNDYVKTGEDIIFYYRKVLEPGDVEDLISSITVNNSTTNEYANKKITIRIEVFAVYPNPIQIAESDLKNAPQGWIEEVYEKMNDIFRERQKKKSIFS